MKFKAVTKLGNMKGVIHIKMKIGANIKRLCWNLARYLITAWSKISRMSLLSDFASYLASNPRHSISSIIVLMPIALGLY